MQYSQRIKTNFLHNTSTNLLLTVFTKNQSQLLYNTSTKLLHTVFTRNQNHLFTQYCDKTAASSVHKESKPTFYAILRQNCCIQYSQRIKTNFLHNTAKKLLHLAFTKNQNQLFTQYFDKNAVYSIHKKSKPTFYTILRQNCCIQYSQRIKTTFYTILLQNCCMQYSQRIKTNVLHNTSTKRLHTVFTKNQNQLFTQYFYKTAACSIHKESKPNFYTILRQNCCLQYSQIIKTNFLHNTSTKLLLAVFTKNQNQLFTQYFDKTAACSIHKESKQSFYTIL